ncbi:MAG TPA: bifunctional glycosyltransferase family 2 protein/CDP-glycerol:glycerophosphate glycerophosphotransferase [Solirubrobacteraceae bacterium]|nr:bifunctional glycosyltransferase family 2 protein/CDP-glycerol:glycerophosphate glycerophosphotransferase [Solirubrobacteraceae bacterium]
MSAAAPALSFVLVVHREQAYIEQCVASLLGQPFGDVELLAVDDASPDHAPRLLDELAERDARVRVLHLPERIGPGAARNLALEEIAGEHVWFVETTDVVAPGALAEIAERLRASAPDVLLVEHAVRDRLGRSRPGPNRAALAHVAELGPGPLERRAELAGAAPRAWDKVLRRAFLRGLGARFDNGGHGELPVTWPALLAADAIAASPGVGYLRRRPGNAVRDRFTAGSPFDVFAAYDAVFAFADAQGVPDERRRLVLEPMLRHQLSLLRPLPEHERREFFRRASESYNRHRRGDEPEPDGRAAQLRATLVERDGYRAFALLEESLAGRRAAHHARVAAARLKRRTARRLRHAELQRHYRSRLAQPIDPDLAVFAAYWYRGYQCNPRAIYEKARELVPGMRGVWVVKPGARAGLPDGVERVLPGTRDYYDVLARARYFVNNVNFPNHLVKREGTVHVMTHHGTPLKHMGLDLQQAAGAGSRMDFAALMRRCARWDYSISSNEFSTLVWERVYPTSYESLEFGYPRNDVLARAGDDMVQRARAELGIRPDQRAVLYAPTHRDYRADYVPVLDVAAVADALGSDHVLMARLHYFYDSDPLLRRLHGEGRVRDVAAHPSVEQLCLAADALVTDYSSIMFDYAVLDRPIVIHAPDWEAYRVLRGTYFDLLAEPPGVVTRSESDVVEALRSGAADDDGARRARAAFRARFCALEDGRAAERVVRRVWLGSSAPATPPVPSVAR